MSVLATVAPVVTSTPVPTIAVHAVTVATTHTNSILDTLNALASKVSVADLTIAAGAITTGVQYLLNRYANLRKTANWLISFALPTAGAVIASVVQGTNDLHLAPVVYLLAQVIYFSIERIKASVTTTEPVTTATTEF